MTNKTCCGFGHRQVFANLTEKLDTAVESAISDGIRTFLTGGMGDFDQAFIGAVYRAKNRHPKEGIKLILVKPYFSNELNTNREYYETAYDDVLIPEEVMGVHYKSAITVRNKWMADESDLVIAYVNKNGGAQTAVKYAIKQGKTVINLADAE